MNFCAECSQPTCRKIPEGDNRERDICTRCDTIFYSNPKNVCGCILEWQGKILLCKRAIEPRYGYWTVPAGFMENSETSAAGAAREAQEEANAESDNLQLFALYNLPSISQIYIMYRGILRDGFASVGSESLEVGLYDEDEIPWDELAFTVIDEALKQYFADRRAGVFAVHSADIVRRPGRRPEVIHHA